MFDGKMSASLSGAGGAIFHMSQQLIMILMENVQEFFTPLK